jgi:hypothetical protein
MLRNPCGELVPASPARAKFDRAMGGIAPCKIPCAMQRASVWSGLVWSGLIARVKRLCVVIGEPCFSTRSWRWPASGYGLVEFRGLSRLRSNGDAVLQRSERTSLSLVFSSHLACRQVCVTPGSRPLDCFRLCCRDGGSIPISKIRFIDPHAMHDDRQLACHGSRSRLDAAALSQPDAP